MTKNLLITGTGGFIGKNLKEFLQNKYTLFTPRSFELNLLDEVAVKAYMTENKIDIIIHGASFGARINTNDTMEEVGQKNILMFQNIAKNLPAESFMISLGSGAEYDKSKPLKKLKNQPSGIQSPKTLTGIQNMLFQKKLKTTKIL
jgi:GDP-L-fucose synthase